MPYHYDEHGTPIGWRYEHEIPSMGDSTYVAYQILQHDLESYLFDFTHPGYRDEAFLNWATVRADSFRGGSGGVAQDQLRWNPAAAGVKPVLADDSPRAKTDLGLRYTDAAIEAPHIDTSPDRPGDADLYLPHEVTDPSMARFYRHGHATVVEPRSHEDRPVAVTPGDPESPTGKPPAEVFVEAPPENVVGDEDKHAFALEVAMTDKTEDEVLEAFATPPEPDDEFGMTPDTKDED